MPEELKNARKTEEDVDKTTNISLKKTPKTPELKNKNKKETLDGEEADVEETKNVRFTVDPKNKSKTLAEEEKDVEKKAILAKTEEPKNPKEKKTLAGEEPIKARLLKKR